MTVETNTLDKMENSVEESCIKAQEIHFLALLTGRILQFPILTEGTISLSVSLRVPRN